MKRLNFMILAAFMASTTATAALAETSGKPLSAIPYLTEINKAGFNVTVRKPADAAPTAAPAAPKQVAKPAAVTTPAPADAVTNRVRLVGKNKETVLGLSGDGHLTVNGMKSFTISPGPIIVPANERRAMTRLSCARGDARKVKLGYTVYTKDGFSLGYMVDYKLKSGSHFDTFRVVTFPTHMGKPVCLQFDGTNPYPNDRIKNQPKVSATLADIKSGMSLYKAN